MPATSEIAIVRAILRDLNSRPETYARKTHGGRYANGWPDVVGCHRGRMLALEVKRPGGKPTPLQVAEIAKWEKAGAIAAIVYSVDDVRLLLSDERSPR